MQVLETAVNPRNWGDQQMVNNVLMTSQIQLLDTRLLPVTVLGAAGTTGKVGMPKASWEKSALAAKRLSDPGSTANADVVHVKFNMRYFGNVTNPNRIQEVPAFFVDRGLGVLAVYNSSAPWTNSPNLTYMFPGGVSSPVNAKATENWAAWIDAASSYGIGIYVPVSSSLTSYR